MLLKKIVKRCPARFSQIIKKLEKEHELLEVKKLARGKVLG
jgi:hypothetical protein